MEPPSNLADAKMRVREGVKRRSEMLIGASRQIHADPELGFEEFHAHDLLCGILEDEGLKVTRSAYGLDTAFAARAGTEGPMVAVLCEYDALPGIGHACGHNIIATAGLGAGLAAADLADELGGSVLILGTPAEEGGGGKALMAAEGAFDGVDCALMVHPAGLDLTSMHAIAVQQLLARYKGAAAHAAAAPHRGRNALDGAVLGYMNIAALRQHIRDDERIHGVFTDGGDKPNIVPATAATHWYVRSRTSRSLAHLKERVVTALGAGAMAAGVEFEHKWLEPAYTELVENPTMVDLYRDNVAVLGRTLVDHRSVSGVIGSTDMGNVSLQVPSIHPMIACAPPDVAIHTPRFAEFAGGDMGDRAVIDGAMAMAMTTVDLWLRPEVLESVQAEFAAQHA